MQEIQADGKGGCVAVNVTQVSMKSSLTRVLDRLLVQLISE